MIDGHARRSFEEQGYVVARALFDADETAFWRDHFMRLREAGAYPGDVVGVEPGSDDPLKKYPRIIHMHRWDPVAHFGITLRFDWTAVRWSSNEASAAARAASGWTATAGRRSS